MVIMLIVKSEGFESNDGISFIYFYRPVPSLQSLQCGEFLASHRSSVFPRRFKSD